MGKSKIQSSTKARFFILVKKKNTCFLEEVAPGRLPKSQYLVSCQWKQGQHDWTQWVTKRRHPFWE